jgi:hypothetical protein
MTTGEWIASAKQRLQFQRRMCSYTPIEQMFPDKETITSWMFSYLRSN